ncbi:unnamed protein product, partial [Larinioides sclopetarius]
KCEKDDNCANGGTCNTETGKCNCLTGTNGVNCKNIEGCDQLNCQTKSATCVFDVAGKMPTCKCNADNFYFEEDDCHKKCEKDDNCANGGTCNTETGKCNCLTGTNGVNCKNIEGCDQLNCQTKSATCVFDVAGKMPTCKCNADNFYFEEDDCHKKCEKDDNCANGGTCNTETGKCNCPTGTNGVNCKNIEGCDQLNCQTKSATCVFDVAGKMPTCKCNADNFYFEEDDCHKKCEKDDNCANGGTCNTETGKCNCPTGTNGVNCKNIEGCDQLNCQTKSATCVFDVAGKMPTCKCNADNFYFEEDDCHKKCEKDDNCANGGTCKTETGKCNCLTGTNGVYCKIIEGCDQLNCQTKSATCVFDVAGKMPTCKCNDDNFYYEEEQCNKKCDKDEDCENGATCKTETGKCNCFTGTNGLFCKNIEGCDQLNCQTINATCVFDVAFKKPTCKCNEENFYYEEEKCIELTSTVAPTTTSTISSSTDTTEHSKETAETTFDQSSTSEEKSSSETTTPVSPTSISSTVTPKVTDDGGKDVCAEKQPCENGGTCELDDEGGYTCKCRAGFTGRNCETAQWCLDNKEICGNTACKYDENVGSAFCSCNGNLYFDAKRKTCVELDKCSLARIKGNCSGDHETCDEMGICKCEENYAYNDDQSVCEPDFCQKKSLKPRCKKDMDCVEGEQRFSCFCKKDFWQIGSKCVKVDKCAPGVSNCEHKCLNGTCSCFPGFSLNENNYSCDLPDTDTECELNCGKGVCVKKGSTEKCICPEISHVLENNTCVDKCKAERLKKNECPEEMGCLSDEEFGYKCNCTGKYDYAEDGVHCKAKRMCSDGGGDVDCLLKGGVCEDNFDSNKGYKCKCKFGYKENQNTHKCEHMCKMADCDKKQALCSINVNNTVECICPPLLVKDTNGSCSRLAKYSYIGDFSVPKRNYEVITGIDSGRKKRDTFKDINYAKMLKDFEDSMNKIFDDYKGTSILNCTDEEEDWKCFLEIKLDKNPKEKLNIISTPSVCLPLSEQSYCLIPPDFITRKRTADDAQAFQQTNPCDKGVIGKFCGIETECTVSKPGFSCKCKPGYFRRTSFVPAKNIQVEVCEDIDECLNPTICPNTTTCLNLPGDYNCKCKNGYRLEEGEAVKTHGCRAVCEPNPCVHGTCAEAGKDGFSCSCEELYTGRFCNQTNEAIIGAKKAGIEISAIVGGVLGAFLVMAIIICIILYRKVRKSKSIDENEEYMRQRNRGLASDMFKLGRRQPENKDIELRENERRPNRENEDLKYNPQLRNNPIDSLSIPRPHMGRSIDKDANNGRERPEIRESGDYRRVYSDDDKFFPKPHSSRQSGEETRRSDYRQEVPRRPLSRSSDHLDNEKIGVSRMQYRNRGYEED